jgi:tight adherence protein B
MVNIAPFAIFLGAAATAALAFFAFWDTLHGGVLKEFKRFALVLDRAGLKRQPEEMVITWVTITAAVWIVAVWFVRPSVVVGLLLLPIAAAAAGGLYAMGIQFKLRQRTEAFLNQFETTLRLMASGLRSGMGLQQTITLITDEMKDPARYEFARVLGQANIGVSIHDALDDLAQRIQTNETLMMARVIRINSQTGGDLGRVIEQLANTIRERRRMRRKVSSLTAEGRAGALVLGALPIFLGGFILMTQAEMAHGLLYTSTGHTVLLIIAVLEILGVFTLARILKVNV